MFYINEADGGAGWAGSLTPENAGRAGAPIFCCSLGEVRELVRRSAERERAWLRFEAFLAAAGVERNFSHLHLTGPFFSRGERACEMDAALQTRSRFGPAAFAAVQPFLGLGLREIRARYGVRLRFWVKGAPAGLRLLRGWDAVDPDALSRRGAGWTRQGIVRVELGGAGR
jgi:hypothetical protein